MSAKEEQLELITHWTSRMVEIVQLRNNLNQDDLEYVVSTLDKLKDERLKQCVATLIGWGDDEREELETFIKLSLILMGQVKPSTLRTAARELRDGYIKRRLVEDAKQ